MALWTDKPVFDRIIDLLGQIEKAYIKFNAARDSIVDYFRPDLGSDITPDGDGTFFGENIYEGTGPWAARVMARGFQGGLVTEATDWIDYIMQQTELRDNDQLDIWLQDVKDHMSDVYQHSNLYTVLPNFTLDGVTTGSPVMFVEEDVVSGVIKYLPQHYETVFMFYNKFNEPIGVIVKDETWTAKDISDKFAPTKEEQELKLSKSVNNNIENGRFYKEHTIIRAVFKGDDPLWDREGFTKPDRDWISVYFEEKPEEERKDSPLQTDGFFSRPFVNWDIDKKPWESISRTPAFSAIYDVITQQQVKKNQLENLALKNRPPRAVLSDHRNVVNFGPEGLSYYSKEDFNFIPKVMDVIGDIKLSKDELADGREAIKRWFRTDAFLKFTDLTTTLKQQPTATQINRIAAELNVQLNPEISTYTGGFLRAVDDRAIDIESRAGRGPFDPETMARITDIVVGNSRQSVTSIGVSPIFIGPLAREQRTQQELDPILTGLAALQPLLATFPDLKFAIREYGTAEDILKAVNFPLKNLVPEDEYDQIVAELNEARERIEQEARAIELAKASKDVSGPVDETSVLAGARG